MSEKTYSASGPLMPNVELRFRDPPPLMTRFATLTRKDEKALLKVQLWDYQDVGDLVLISFRWPPSVVTPANWTDANNWIRARYLAGDQLYLTSPVCSRRCTIDESSIEFGMDGVIQRFTLRFEDTHHEADYFSVPNQYA